MTFNVRHTDDIIILHPKGEIIGPASREFRNVMAEQLGQVSETPKFLIDFADVPMMDSTALGVLMGTHITIAPQNGRIVVINVGKQIKNLIATAKLTTVFEHFESQDAAVAALKVN